MAFDFISFDVDGVLADSLRPHMQFCKDEAKKFKIQLPNKSPKEIVDNPMEKLLLKAGFPQELMPELIKDYKALFPQYKVLLFYGVPGMIVHLKEEGKQLGIATSNRRSNVENVMGPYFKLIDHFSSFDTDKSKSEGLIRTIEESGAQNPVFVGDTEKDYNAALEARVPFIGVSYGWEIDKEESRFPVAHSINQLTDMLTK